MKLNVKPRTAEKKRDSKRLRREGAIPAVLYGRSIEAQNIVVVDNEFQALLRKIPKGRLSTTVFTLAGEGGKLKQAIIKDIQYHPTTYHVLHLDFEELQEKVRVNINVPIECVGVAECVGVKQGGTLRQVIRTVRISCFPQEIPPVFILDVKNLGVRQHRKLSEIEMPASIRPITDLKEVAVVVAKKR